MCENRLAQVLAVTGDRDGAFDKLSKLVKLPFGLNYGDLKLNPMWDDLRDDPRFDKLIAEAAQPIPLYYQCVNGDAFYHYARANPNGRPQLWSEWLKSTAILSPLSR